MAKLRRRLLGDGESRWPTRCERLPLVIEPEGGASAGATTSAIREERTSLRDAITSHGAILIRNAAYDRPEHFVAVMDALDLDYAGYPYLTDNYRSPVIEGIVNASSTVPPLPVPPHTEQAFSAIRPGIVGFMCLERAAGGGETPLHDCVAIYAQLGDEAREVLQGTFFCKSTRRMTAEGLRSNFNTLDRGEIERLCARFGLEWSWHGDALSFVTKGPCVVTHPLTGETALSCFWTVPSLHHFFRHYHAHPGADRLLGIVCRITPLAPFDLLCRSFHPFFRKNYRYFFARDGRRVHVPLRVHEELNAAVWRNTTMFAWEPGDILLIDNVKAGHSRMPFVPPRRIVASICNYYDAHGAMRRGPA